MKRRQPFQRTASRGFSLIEVVIGMTILAMISTTLFAIIKGSVKGASDIEKLQRENDQVNRFIEQCRLTIDTMPASATLTLTTIDQGSGVQEFKISGVSTCFPFGPNPVSYSDTTIGLRPDVVKPMSTGPTPMPRYNLGITRTDIIPQTSNTTVMVQQSSVGPDADEQGRPWMPLLPGVVQLQWEFYQDSTKQWLPEWSTTQWPGMIRMHLMMDGRTQPLTMTFTPPELQLRPSTGPAAPTATTDKSGLAAAAAGGKGGKGGKGEGGRGGKGGKGGEGGKGNRPPGGKGGRGGGKGNAGPGKGPGTPPPPSKGPPTAAPPSRGK